jgi:hypothetical protein
LFFTLHGQGPDVQFATWRSTVIGLSRLFLAVTIVAAGSASALAQTNASSATVAASASHKAKVAPRQSGRISDPFPRASSPRNSEDPSVVGGGSLGYNDMVVHSDW